MKEKDERPVYEPPRARDLSVESATGQVHPMGICMHGGHPYTECVTGITADPSTNYCTTGATFYPEECNTGSGVDDQPQCNTGSWALVACFAGGDAG